MARMLGLEGALDEWCWATTSLHKRQSRRRMRAKEKAALRRLMIENDR